MFTTQDSAASGVSLLDYPAPAGRVIRGAFDEALETNPIPLWMMSAEVNHARSIGPIMPKADAEQQATFAGVKVKVPDEGISQGALSLLIERRRDEAARQLLFARREGIPAAIGSFAASLAGTLFDPLNVAAGFIPVLGGTRYEALLEKAVGAGQRAGLRAGTGLAEGAVGAAVVEAPTQALRRDLQDDYSLYDSLANIAFGTLASGGIRVAGGAAKDVWAATRRLREIQQQQLQDIMPGLERSMQEELEQGFARGPGIPEELKVQWEAARRAGATEEELSRLLVMRAARKEGTRQRVAREGADAEQLAVQQRTRFSEAEIDAYVKAEERMRAEAAAPDDRRLLSSADIAERKFREMDLAEVRARLERGEGLIAVPGNPREVLQAIGADTHAQALKAAVAQAIEGRRIDVDAVVRQDPVFGQERQGLEVVRSRARSQQEPENLVCADRQASEAATEAVEAGPPKPTETPAAQATEAPGAAGEQARAPAATPQAEAPAAGEPVGDTRLFDAMRKAGGGDQEAGWDVLQAIARQHMTERLAGQAEPPTRAQIEKEMAALYDEVLEGKHDAAIERARTLARGADEWEAIADELRAVDLEATRENVLDTDAVARASSIDEAAVERAALMHAADDADFMSEVREIIREADENAKTAGRGTAPQGKARSAAARADTAAAETVAGPLRIYRGGTAGLAPSLGGRYSKQAAFSTTTDQAVAARYGEVTSGWLKADAKIETIDKALLEETDIKRARAKGYDAIRTSSPEAEVVVLNPDKVMLQRGLEDPEIQQTLRDIARNETGWAQEGGKLDLGRFTKAMREMGQEPFNEQGQLSGTQHGIPAFTSWIPNAEWWMSRPDKKLGPRGYEQAVEKAIAGKKLKPIEKRAVDFLLEMANERLGLHEELGGRMLARDALADTLLKGPDEKPLQLFHGTADRIDQFDLDHPNRKDSGWLGTGVYMTSDPELASSYATLKAGGDAPNVMPLYANIQNPYYATLEDKRRLQGISNAKGREAGREAADAWTEQLKKKGHDGVVLKYDPKDVGESNASTEVVVFDPSQVIGAFEERPAKAAEANPQIQEAEALLAETRQNADQAARDAGAQAPAPSTERAKADEYEKAYKAIGDCAPKEGS